MNPARFLVTVSTFGLMFACLTGQIHRPGIWQGSILTILAGLGMMAAQLKTIPASATRKLGMIYLPAAMGSLALLVARNIEPAAANWLFAVDVVLIALPILLILGVSRPVG